MIQKRPHVLKYTIETPGAQDANGYWNSGTTSTIEVPCRAEAASGGKTVRTEDGQDMLFNYTIYIDVIPGFIQAGSIIELPHNGWKGRVLRFEKEQAKCRIWA